jgi:hypothetical protein
MKIVNYRINEQHPSWDLFKQIFKNEFEDKGFRDATDNISDEIKLLMYYETRFKDWECEMGKVYKYFLNTAVATFNQISKTHELFIYKFHDGELDDDRWRYAEYWIGINTK